ncbi:MAG: S49 family peptidase [Myxococcales bacterium]|nr:S49 family peptidase [Myxococcales bacterium]
MVAVIDLTKGAAEQESSSLLAAPHKRSFDDLLRALDDVAKDKDSKGVLIKLGSANLGIARAEELGDKLSTLRAKLPIHCQADGLTNATFMVAARGCTKIWLSPAGELETIGIAAQVLYFRKLLADELKLSIDFLQVGKFKGAEEPLTRDGPSAEARESLESVLRDLRGSWVGAIKQGRGDAVAELVEDGPYSPPKAKEKKLVDEVGYVDDALAALKTATGAQREEIFFGKGSRADKQGDMGALVRVLSGDGPTSGPVALVVATGSISMEGGASILGGRSGITEKDLGKILTKLEKEDSIKAVVLRIDSPGGSALASDLLWQKLMKIRKKKPIVVSVGDMAASGGYYLASTANVIFADPTSIVGSIGVVGGKIGFGPALERIGVHAETFPASNKPGAANRAAYMSAVTPWDDATRARVLETMSGVYELFLARVAEGRKTTPDKIAPHAEGRIFTGRQGKERGLVDELGGLELALARARKLASLPDDAEVAVFGSRRTFFEGLDDSGDAEEQARSAAAARASFVSALDDLAPELVPFVSSVAPIASGERALCAVPFALTIR